MINDSSIYHTLSQRHSFRKNVIMPEGKARKTTPPTRTENKSKRKRPQNIKQNFFYENVMATAICQLYEGSRILMSKIRYKFRYTLRSYGIKCTLPPHIIENGYSRSGIFFFSFWFFLSLKYLELKKKSVDKYLENAGSPETYQVALPSLNLRIKTSIEKYLPFIDL